MMTFIFCDKNYKNIQSFLLDSCIKKKIHIRDLRTAVQASFLNMYLLFLFLQNSEITSPDKIRLNYV